MLLPYLVHLNYLYTFFESEFCEGGGIIVLRDNFFYLDVCLLGLCEIDILSLSLDRPMMDLEKCATLFSKRSNLSTVVEMWADMFSGVRKFWLSKLKNVLFTRSFGLKMVS